MARDHKSSHARGLGTTMVSLKADNDIVDLFSANTLACLDIKTMNGIDVVAPALME